MFFRNSLPFQKWKILMFSLTFKHLKLSLFSLQTLTILKRGRVFESREKLLMFFKLSLFSIIYKTRISGPYGPFILAPVEGWG